MDNKRPRSREKNVTGPGKSVQKHGAGLGSGPVGDAGGYADRKQQNSQAPGTRSAGNARSGGGMKIILILLAVLLGGGGGLTALLGGQPDSAAQTPAAGQQQNQPQSWPPCWAGSTAEASLPGGRVSRILGSWTAPSHPVRGKNIPRSSETGRIPLPL